MASYRNQGAWQSLDQGAFEYVSAGGETEALAGIIAGVATVAGDIVRNKRVIAGSLAGVASLTSKLNATLALFGLSVGTSSATALLNALIVLSGTIPATSVLSATLTESATRFYLPSTGTPSVSPSYGSSWNVTSYATRLSAVTTKISSSMSTISISDDSTSDNLTYLFVQYVSERLAAQTISAQTVKWQIRSLESTTSNNLYNRIAIRSWNGSTFQTILSITSDGTELSSSELTNRMFSATTTGVTVAEGDRLIIEIGYGGDPAISYNHNGSIRVGDSAASDLPENDTSTDDYNPWVEFANAITFSSLELISGTVSGLSTLSGLVGRIRPVVGSFAGTSSLSAIINKLAAIAGVSGAVSTTSAKLNATVRFSGAIAGQSSVSALINALIALSASVSGISTLSGDLLEAGNVPLSGIIVSTSTLTGALRLLGWDLRLDADDNVWTLRIEELPNTWTGR